MKAERQPSLVPEGITALGEVETPVETPEGNGGGKDFLVRLVDECCQNLDLRRPELARMLSLSLPLVSLEGTIAYLGMGVGFILPGIAANGGVWGRRVYAFVIVWLMGLSLIKSPQFAIPMWIGVSLGAGGRLVLEITNKKEI